MNRRDFLSCMAWAGSGVLWSMRGGVASPAPLGAAPKADFHFVQLSDSHLGFNKAANPDVAGTFAASIAAANAANADFVVHTGDITHLTKPEEFDVAKQLMSKLRGEVHYVPGEHDMLDDDKKLYFQHFGRPTKSGAYSFDRKGVHFVALVNVETLTSSGAGSLGADQIAWLADDLRALKSDTPVVVFAHMPMWPIYTPWGWATDDAEAALAHLRRFGSVTVLNGHIHQVVTKVEGTVHFHTATSTAYPQPVAGAAPSPGPLKVPLDHLREVLGVTDVRVLPGPTRVTDVSLVRGGAMR